MRQSMLCEVSNCSAYMCQLKKSNFVFLIKNKTKYPPPLLKSHEIFSKATCVCDEFLVFLEGSRAAAATKSYRKGRFSMHLSIRLAGWAWGLAGPEAWLDGPKGGMDGQTDGQTDGWTENLPILQNFVPYRGRCPTSPHENQGESRAGQGNRWPFDAFGLLIICCSFVIEMTQTDQNVIHFFNF